jgi:TonB family protein
MLVRKLAVLVAVAVISFTQVQAQSATAAPASGRKVTSRVAPNYPDLAKKMHLQGTVKIEATVRPNGTVRATKVLGGNPVLMESASDAVKQWKFESTPGETNEVVQITFASQ